ncbi:signal peptidase I [Candidatus Woesearchaeota archaeon CG_4_10_14_0_2_um_filter_33_13]|nr:MAG: signal peptidase I [Candidatus Woesearchaeota archaeon CG_4_10_14_0_2_um_filter_33_13]
MVKWERVKRHSKKTWNFFWNDDSLASWVANVIVAFLLIRFVVYPVLGVVLGTSYPIVAVISESMDHGTVDEIICGKQFKQFPESFDNYWKACGDWYEEEGIIKGDFAEYPFDDGFRKGDVIVLWKANPQNLKVGDVLVFQGAKPQPIIHRVIRIWQEEGKYFYQTKGDHNNGVIGGALGEEKISQERILGKGLVRIPYLGWLKILFVDAVKPLGINIQR